MWFAKMWWLYTVVIIIYLINLTKGNELSSQPKIIIVGAGPSGIAAASKLYENGFENVTILEAEDRIGGRIHTIWFSENWIDLGGQWVHGQTNNIAYELASPLGLLEVPQPEDALMPIVYNSDGIQIPQSITDNFITLLMDLEDRSTDELQGNDSGSAGDYFNSRIITEAGNFSGVDETLLKKFIILIEGFQNLEDASDNWYNTSAKEYTEFWTCPGSHTVNWKDRGYKTILDILMKKYPNPEDELPVVNNTMINTEVANINYNSTDGKVSIESSDGKKYEADHVIFTPSLGVMKEQHETLFTPKLSESKVKIINGLGMGTVAKIFFFFDTTWWPTNSGFSFMWNDSDKQEYESDPDKKWLLDIVGFWSVAHRPRLLLGWMKGEGGRHMELLPEEQVLNQTLELFNKFLGKSYNIPRPTSFKRTQWYSNKHFRGTYSYRSMASRETHFRPEELSVPIMTDDKPIVMFAGEATSHHHFSTVQGAIESGFREANRLIDIYKTTPK